MPQHQLTFDQLPDVIFTLIGKVDLLQASISAINNRPEAHAANQDIFIGVSAAAKLLGLADQTIYDMVCNKKIPYYKPRRRLQFLESELIEWIKNGRKGTALEDSRKADEFMLNRENQ
jgi:excisionase family DNA binding protein